MKTTERPILFSGPMVRAILEGRKTQTRGVFTKNDSGGVSLGGKNWHISDPNCIKACPHGQVGDRLWVRETLLGYAFKGEQWNEEFWYMCGGVDALGISGTVHNPDGIIIKYPHGTCPSIHMPRWTSRITLEIIDIRIERLQDISELDVKLEGFEPECRTITKYGKGTRVVTKRVVPAKDAFYSFWNTLNAKRGHGWDTNPWVWVVSFKVVQP